MSTIAKELDRAGIPNAVITGFTSIAENVGANRIVSGGHFTHPIGNLDLPPDRERDYRRQVLLTALKAVTEMPAGPTVYEVHLRKEG